MGQAGTAQGSCPLEGLGHHTNNFLLKWNSRLQVHDNHHIHNFTARKSTSLPHLTQLKMSTAELATSYAALILADDGVEITVRNHQQISRKPVARSETSDGRQSLRAWDERNEFGTR